jgi:flagellar biosynthesis protein
MSRSPSDADPSPAKRPVAVALEEQPDGAAPTVIASGRGAIAEQILNIAFANGVKVREDADLVQILAAVDVDSPIPTEAFAAVAEILSRVYRANHQMPRGFAAEHHTPPFEGPSP